MLERAEDPIATLREALLDAQHELITKKPFAVVLVVSGLESSGRSDTMNLLSEWLDSRHFHVHALGLQTSEEEQRPPFWQVWRRLPPKGEIGVFYRGWQSPEIFDDPSVSDVERAQRIAGIVRLERMLAAEGVLVLNFIFNLRKKDQRKRLKALARDPRTAWRATKKRWRELERYDASRELRLRTLDLANTPETPWMLIESPETQECAFQVGQTLLDALRTRLAAPGPPEAPSGARSAKRPETAPLPALDLSLAVPPEEYKHRLQAAQEKLALLVLSKKFRRRSLVAAFEGWDAAGKGGAIRRLTRGLDARQYTTIPIAAPTDEERAQPYLWRFWRHVPGRGRIAIFDRTWYGRVLVERVEGFAREPDWRRAYEEINDFEAQLVANGAILVKLWLEISKEEQLARFQAREKTGFKRYKITEEDWRNREKWDAYALALAEMVSRTSTREAPWTLVEANDKYHARVKVLETVVNRLEEAVG
jgi:polyphosphate:AMP phosphotransferase